MALYAIGGWSWLVWGGFLRTIFVLHTTWLVNSATHIWGYRTHETRDHSTNLWWVALLTYGEGWHNNHHAFQTSAKHGLAWWEVDPTYWAIRSMSFVGLTHSIKMPKTRSLKPETSGHHGAEAVEGPPRPRDTHGLLDPSSGRRGAGTRGRDRLKSGRGRDSEL